MDGVTTSCNFDQREYDYADLEKKLLDRRLYDSN